MKLQPNLSELFTLYQMPSGTQAFLNTESKGTLYMFSGNPFHRTGPTAEKAHP